MNQPSTSSGSIATTAGAQTVTGPGILTYAACSAAGAAGTITVYDGTSTSGLLLVKIAGITDATTQSVNISDGVVFNTGLFIAVAGGTSTGVVHYRRN